MTVNLTPTQALLLAPLVFCTAFALEVAVAHLVESLSRRRRR